MILRLNFYSASIRTLQIDVLRTRSNAWTIFQTSGDVNEWSGSPHERITDTLPALDHDIGAAGQHLTGIRASPVRDEGPPWVLLTPQKRYVVERAG